VQNQLFEAALGIAKPWYVNGVDFDAAKKILTISVDFVAGTRFPAAGFAGAHQVHDTQMKRLRHLNFFQHECFLEVRTPRLKLPDGRVAQFEPDWFGKLAGFTLLFEALVLVMAQQMALTAGATWDDVAVRRVFTVDVDELQAAMCDPSTERPENSEHPPTSTMIGVTRLSHPDFLIEIDLVAITEA
jgi:transposase